MHTTSSRLLMAALLTQAALGCRPNASPSGDQPDGLPAGPSASDSLTGDSPRADSAPDDLKALAASLTRSYAEQGHAEAARMLMAILQGARMAPGEGWFGPGQSRYSWHWLADAHDASDTAEIVKDQFRGNPLWFERLDRNRDGRIVAADLDWSDANGYVQEYLFTNDILQQVDKQRDGRLTRDEWLALFEQAAGERAHATTADLAELLLAGRGSEDMLDPAELLRALSRGDFGSPNEGPSLNSPAPDFQLKTQDGKRTIRLRDFKGSKPVVLVFGNYTCGPFRVRFPLVDDLRRRYQDEVEFLAIYVREAHASDGWRMVSNERSGIKIAQPKSYDERATTAQLCRAALNCSMPLLVDTIDDEVNNRYSGAPMRLYVIDREGKVAYKSGRGPFGFKPAELEQALLMTLVDQQMQN